MMSLSAAHYPEVDRPIIAMAKEFAASARTGRHRHDRAQLIHAIKGIMVARTDAGAWLVPRGYALWVPPKTHHDVFMHGSVSMRTIYVRAADAVCLQPNIRVIAVSPLLQAAIVALSIEPPAYDERGRGQL